jgi:hypothetical protein
MSVRRVLVVAACVAMLIASCAFVPGIGNDRIHVVNSTTLLVTLVVNGRQIAVVQPSAGADAGPSELGSMPWHAVVRTASGRELVTIDVAPGSVQDVHNADGTGSYSAPAARIDLSCGQIRLYAGRIMPGGPAPGPGSPGDCLP